jgi:hypothetical protein
MPNDSGLFAFVKPDDYHDVFDSLRHIHLGEEYSLFATLNGMGEIEDILSPNGDFINVWSNPPGFIGPNSIAITTTEGVIQYDLTSHQHVLLDSCSELLGASSDGLLLITKRYPLKDTMNASDLVYLRGNLEVYDTRAHAIQSKRWTIRSPWSADNLGNGKFGIRGWEHDLKVDFGYYLLNTASPCLSLCLHGTSIVRAFPIRNDSVVVASTSSVCVSHLPIQGGIGECFAIGFPEEYDLINDTLIAILAQSESEDPTKGHLRFSSSIDEQGVIRNIDGFRRDIYDLSVLDLCNGKQTLIAHDVRSFVLSHDKKKVAFAKWDEKSRLRVLNLNIATY